MNILRSIGNKDRAILGLNPLWSTASNSGFGVGRRADAFDSVWVIGGVEAKGEAVAQLPIKYVDYNGRAIERMDQTQKQIAALLANPNQMLFSGPQLWQLTAMQYELCGSAFWVLQNEFGNPIQSPLEMPASIMVYGTNNIFPRYSESGSRVVGWSLRDGATSYSLAQFQLIRFWKANPKSFVDGLKITDKIGTTLNLDKGAKKTNSNFFKNGARPSGIIQAKSDRVDNAELRKFAQNFSDDFGGPDNSGKFPALPSTIEFKQDQSVRDMDFKELHESNRSEFFGSTRVPKFHMGVTDDVNYATAEILDSSYWVNVIQPMTRIFQDIVNNSLLLGSGMRMEFSFENVAALRLSHLRVQESENKVLEGKWRIANRMWRQGYPVNVISQSLGLPVPELKATWANEPHDPTELGAGAQPIAGESNRMAGGVEKSPFDLMAANMKSIISISVRGQKERSILDAVKESDFEAMNEFCRSVESSSIGSVIPQFEKAMRSYYSRLLASQLKRFESFVSGDEYQSKADGEREVTKENVGQVLFSREKWDAILIADTKALYFRAYQSSIDVVKDELGGFSVFQPTDELAASAARDLAVKVVGINDRLRSEIRNSIVSVIESGGSRSDMVNAIESVFSDRIARVSTVARTETGFAMNEARYKAISSERPTKQWVSANDSSVRESHRGYASLGSKPMDYQYNRGLSHPQDQRADADEVINCRCVLVSGE